jgi:hypothetical protein
MKPFSRYLTLAAAVLLVAPLLIAAAKIGEPAPEFSLVGSDGKTYNLADFRGKFVVLEWHNQGCPYVKKFYDSGEMQRLQKHWMSKGVVWFKVISSAPGTQGYVTAAQENEYLASKGATPTAALLDPEGVAGRLYDAKTTPQMVVINPQGLLVYDGAIDNRPTANKDDIAGATNYVSLALEQAMAGQPVATASTRPYGCSVKYKD